MRAVYDRLHAGPRPREPGSSNSTLSGPEPGQSQDGRVVAGEVYIDGAEPLAHSAPGAEPSDAPLSRAEFMQLLVLEATHDPELDPCKVPPMVTARLSSFINHPRLFSEICETMTGQIESRLTTAAEAYQKGREADERASSDHAMTWVSHSLSTIKEWPIEKRLPLLVFLDYLTSLPTKVSDADSGQPSMKEFFSADGRAKYWPQTATLPTMLQFARASTTHGQHLRIVGG